MTGSNRPSIAYPPSFSTHSDFEVNGSISLERFSFGCRRRPLGRRSAGLKARRYNKPENALDARKPTATWITHSRREETDSYSDPIASSSAETDAAGNSQTPPANGFSTVFITSAAFRYDTSTAGSA